MTRKVKIEILGDASSLEKAFGRASSKAGGFASGIGRVSKVAAFAVGGAALGGLALTLKEGVAEFAASTKVAAQTEAALRSTGKAAGVTKRQVEALATSLSHMSGVDDDAIQSGENLLLTFTKVRNETGKGNDVFNQATSAMLDMSTALGQDMKSSAIQLGKALNDPIQGLTALKRVGVSFTASQKDQIDALVDSGHSLQAQKLILGELNTEFGGSAKAAGETLPAQLAKMKNAFDEAAGSIVGAAAPALGKIASSIASDVVPRLQDFFHILAEKLGPALNRFSAAVGTAWPTITRLFRILGDYWQTAYLPILKRLGEIGVAAVQAIAQVVKEHMPQIQEIFRNLGTVIKNIGTIVIPILEFAFTKVLPTAIGILIPVLMALTKTLAFVSGGLGKIADGIGWLKDNGAPALGTFWAKVQKPLHYLIEGFKVLLAPLLQIVDAIKWIVENAGKIGGALSSVGGVLGKINPFGGSSATGPSASAGSAPGASSASGNVNLGRSLAASMYGWTGNQFDALFRLWQGESGWNSSARNPSSGAYGIPQSLPADKMASAGADWRTNAATQIKWGLAYIHGRYGSPAAAYSAWMSRSPHWYHGGGIVGDNVPIVARKGEGVFTPGQMNALGPAGGGPIVLQLNVDGREFARAIYDPLRDEAAAQGRIGRNFSR